MTLRNDFFLDIQSAIAQCYKLGYKPTILEKMIQSTDPVEVAKKLITSSDPQYGFRELSKMGRLDLTVEAIMLQPKYNSLFTLQELQAAQWRVSNA